MYRVLHYSVCILYTHCTTGGSYVMHYEVHCIPHQIMLFVVCVLCECVRVCCVNVCVCCVNVCVLCECVCGV